MRIPSWVRQEDEWGCGPACLAMLSGRTYAEVVADFLHSFARSGLDWIRCDSWLADHGYATARKFVNDHNWKPRCSPWPPEPWAEVHLCTVDVSAESSRSHFAVMLANGSCLDPITSEPRRLADYHRVMNVAAVYRVPGK